MEERQKILYVGYPQPLHPAQDFKPSKMAQPFEKCVICFLF